MDTSEPMDTRHDLDPYTTWCLPVLVRQEPEQQYAGVHMLLRDMFFARTIERRNPQTGTLDLTEQPPFLVATHGYVAVPWCATGAEILEAANPGAVGISPSRHRKQQLALSLCKYMLFSVIAIYPCVQEFFVTDGVGAPAAPHIFRAFLTQLQQAFHQRMVGALSPRMFVTVVEIALMNPGFTLSTLSPAMTNEQLLMASTRTRTHHHHKRDTDAAQPPKPTTPTAGAEGRAALLAAARQHR